MTECKYSLIRYVPDPIKNEPVNIGLILLCPTERFLAFDWDLRRVASKITRTDKETLKHYQWQLEAIENEEVDWEQATFETLHVEEPDFLGKVSDYVGEKIVFENPRGCLAQDPNRTFENLFERFVAGRGRKVARVTKRTLVRDVKEVFEERAVSEYVKSKPIVQGEHRGYTLPLGIRHARRTFIEILNLGAMAEKNYRAMAAVGRLWQDARARAVNRDAELFALVHYSNGARVREGERLMEDDGVRLLREPLEILREIDLHRVRQWD